MILISIMAVFGGIGCFTRLQEFLELEERKDGREIVASESPKSSHSLTHGDLDVQPLTDNSSVPQIGDLELSSLNQDVAQVKKVDTSSPILTIENGSFIAGEDIEVLKNISLAVRQGTLSMIVGRVGCGKSSLLKAITGELKLKTGRVILHTQSVAYCDQTPWLQNITIRDNIAGQSLLDEKWLATVIRSCALDEDCSAFPQGDRAIVGSGGVALSGGQKQRVVSIQPQYNTLLGLLLMIAQALARAVYARKRLLVLDDVFSGLDSATSKTVFQRLFGSDGIIRQTSTTVILATHHGN